MRTAPPPRADRARDDLLSGDIGRTTSLDNLHEIARRALRNRPNRLHDGLRRLVDSPEGLARLATRSYWHTNGFAKVRLVVGAHLTLRLHIWPAGTGRGEFDPHGHRWDFASWIAAGEGVTETWYSEHPQGERLETLDLRRWRYDRKDGAEQLLEDGTATLYAQRRMVHRTNEVYGCGIDRLHTVAPLGSDLVITAVLQGPQRRDTTAVYLPPDTMPYGVGRPISVEQLRDLLAEAAAAIEPRCRPRPSSRGLFVAWRST